MEKDIVVVNRIHPDEYEIGEQVDQLFAEVSIRGVRLVTRKVPENARTQRGLIPGSNTIFRQGKPDGDLDEQFIYEVEQAAQDARIVLDMHAHKHKGAPSVPFYGEPGRDDPLVLGIASLLHSDGAQVWATRHLAARLPNYVGWDLAPGTDVRDLCPTLEKLGAGWCPPVRPMTEFSYVRSISAAEGAKYGFEEEYEQFEPLPAEAVAKAGLPPGSCASSWSASLYSTGFWGEAVVPLPKGPR